MESLPRNDLNYWNDKIRVDPYYNRSNSSRPAQFS
jgi:hypothetical protein